MYAIVILKRKYFNLTYASVRFNPYGQPTKYPIIICEDWKSGFEQAKTQGYNQTLFCDSGTVFKDIDEFLEKLDNYPHQGVIGHIIDPLIENEYFSLHPQCFLLDVNKFSNECFDEGSFESYEILRSEINIHDNYTPLWVRPGKNKITGYQSKFGQKIIAAQLDNGQLVSNWHHKLRDNKIYLYRPEIYDNWINLQQEYSNLAEQQLWITNNQDLTFADADHLISPAAGLFWIISAITKSINKITLCDISKNQIALAQALIDGWDGANYGEFVFNFIKNKKLKHLQFDKPLTPLEKLRIYKKEKFCQLVDGIFKQQISAHNLSEKEFQEKWNKVKTIPIDIINDNIVKQITSGNITLTPASTIWISNILDYKYTWINSELDEIDLFNFILKSSGARILE